MTLVAASALKRREGRLSSTIVILVGLMVTRFFLPSDSALGIFTTAAYGVGVTLAVAVIIEASGGIRSLVRVDLLMFTALYGLTLLEFLFRQTTVEGVISSDTATNGTHAVLI